VRAIAICLAATCAVAIGFCANLDVRLAHKGRVLEQAQALNGFLLTHGNTTVEYGDLQGDERDQALRYLQTCVPTANRWHAEFEALMKEKLDLVKSFAEYKEHHPAVR
jgi:hypothetical protein